MMQFDQMTEIIRPEPQNDSVAFTQKRPQEEVKQSELSRKKSQISSIVENLQRTKQDIPTDLASAVAMYSAQKQQEDLQKAANILGIKNS